MSNFKNDLEEALDLAGLEIDELEISNFLDEALLQQSDSVAKVMAASCTTCECCCSCILPLAKTDRLVTAAIARVESYFTPDQLRTIKERDPKHRDPARYAQEEWPVLIAEVAAEMEKGTDPTSGLAQSLARRWVELLHLFTGGHPDIEAKLHEMYKQTPHPAAVMGTVPDQKMIDYMTKAAGALRPTQ
jgi:thiazolylpeptide-type bacteriocin precursor